MSKSPRRVLQVAYDAACQAVPAHRHRFSPKKFTQPQLLACLVLKEFLRLDYRGLAEHLADHGELTCFLDLKVIPHYTTLQKAAARLLKAAPARKLFDAVLDRALRAKVRQRRVPLAAVDGTGMESRHTSRYYVKRRSRTGRETQETTYSTYPKVVLVTDCRSHLVLAAVPGRGPASDLQQFEAAIRDAAGRARIGTLLGGADYDAEWVHEHVRGTYGIRTIIPPERRRPSEKPPVSRWRRWMRQRWGNLLLLGADLQGAAPGPRAGVRGHQFVQERPRLVGGGLQLLRRLVGLVGEDPLESVGWTRESGAAPSQDPAELRVIGHHAVDRPRQRLAVPTVFD